MFNDLICKIKWKKWIALIMIILALVLGIYLLSDKKDPSNKLIKAANTLKTAVDPE